MADQSSSVTGSPPTGRDILTTIPPEILIKIIAQVPSKNYLDLIHTSEGLRTFLKINASRICNEAIRSRFPLEAALLNSELSSGWLVPRSQMLSERENEYLKYQRSCLRYYLIHYSLLGAVVPWRIIRIESAGPQYLHFLEQKLLLMGVGPFNRRNTSHFLPNGKIYEVDFDGQTYYLNISNYVGSVYESLIDRFDAFMERFNKVTIGAQNGKLVPCKEKGGCFPREMIWFFGTEKLSERGR